VLTRGTSSIHRLPCPGRHENEGRSLLIGDRNLSGPLVEVAFGLVFVVCVRAEFPEGSTLRHVEGCGVTDKVAIKPRTWPLSPLGKRIDAISGEDARIRSETILGSSALAPRVLDQFSSCKAVTHRIDPVRLSERRAAAPSRRLKAPKLGSARRLSADRELTLTLYQLAVDRA